MKGRILVVDDLTKNYERLSKMLKPDGWETAYARNERDARYHLRIQPYDIYLIDVELPVVNGFELARNLKADYPAPVIYMVDVQDTTNAALARLNGGADYLVRPITHDDTLTRINAVYRQSALKQAEYLPQQLQDLVLNALGQAVIVSSLQSQQVLFINNTACRIFELTKEQALGNNLIDLLPNPYNSKMSDLDDLVETVGKAYITPEERLPTPQGERKFYGLRFTLADDNGIPTHLLRIWDDITTQLEERHKLRHARERLRKDLSVDPLTGMLNTRGMRQRLKEEEYRHRRNGKDFCLILLDITNLQELTNSYGSIARDTALGNLSTIFAKTLRKQDKVARWSNDNILLLLPETPLNGGQVLANRINQLINNCNVKHHGQEFRLIPRLGLSNYLATSNLYECLKQAQQQLQPQPV